jgi:UDP-N-acetylmuramoyl-L-alanyl-D-glutamate--2,6-diaminopimelate ligase
VKLSVLLADLPIIETRGDLNVEVSGLTKDSREVREGSLFLATESSEPFVAEALRRGAVSVLSERRLHEGFPCSVVVKEMKGAVGAVASRFYGFPSGELFVTGITGTNGKTTTAYLIESILLCAGETAGVVGTISHRFGGKVYEAGNTTPDAVEMHRLLSEMRGAGTRYVAMEVSSHALKQGRVEGIQFDAAVFTNLTHDHLDYHKTLEDYRQSKGFLFSRYLKESRKAPKYAILNMDDPNAKGFVPEEPVRTLHYSLTSIGDAHVISYDENLDGLRLEVSLMGTRLSLVSPLVGLFNASNVLAACLVGHAMGLSAAAIAAGIESLQGVPGRLERVRSDDGRAFFVDYAHTPDALRKVLEMLRRLKGKGRLIALFGCGGDRDRGKRPIMGRIAAELADFTIVTSDNPRREDPAEIVRQVRAGFPGDELLIIEDRRQAIARGVEMTREGDILLVAGKGHEDYQIVGTAKHHFSDREVIEEAIGVAS